MDTLKKEKKHSKRLLIIIPIFFFASLLINYFQARNENRSDYSFVITKIDKYPTGHINVMDEKNKFVFYNFEDYGEDIRIGDSLVKKKFSRYLYINRKDTLSKKYIKILSIKANPNSLFPIEFR